MVMPRRVEVFAGVYLTPTEVRAVRLLAEGMSNKQIAWELCISEHTAVRHLTHVSRKLSVHNRVKVAVWAVRNGVV